MSDPKINKAVEVMLKIRAKRGELKTRYEEEDNALKEQYNKVAKYLLDKTQELGVESFKTEAGTAYRSETLLCSGSDWGMFYDWIIRNEALDALERRIKVGFVRDYLKDHGTPPPGVSIVREYEIKVRRS